MMLVFLSSCGVTVAMFKGDLLFLIAEKEEYYMHAYMHIVFME